MTITQILAWLTGPTVGSALSYILDNFAPWKNWKPEPMFGFNPKAALVTMASLLIGMAAFAAATYIPATAISYLDPYVATAFPLITMIVVQLWHRFVNNGMNTISIKATASSPGSVSAKATSDPEPQTKLQSGDTKPLY